MSYLEGVSEVWDCGIVHLLGRDVWIEVRNDRVSYCSEVGSKKAVEED